MKIASFNINGVKARLPALLEWLGEAKPDVAVAANGDLWFSLLTGFTAGPTAFEFDTGLYIADAGGQPLLVMTQINALAGGSQSDGSLALTSGGDPVVVWESQGSFGDDHSGDSIQVRTSFSMLFADDFETGDLERWNISPE